MTNNEQNLKPPINKRSTEEQREIRRKGGIKSGEARREKAKLKDELLTLLDSKKDKETIRQKISVALIQKALNGDVKAFEVIRDTIGEKPTDKQKVSTSVIAPPVFNILPVSSREKIDAY